MGDGTPAGRARVRGGLASWDLDLEVDESWTRPELSRE